MIKVDYFEDEVQELQTLPKATTHFEDHDWLVRVYPDFPGYPDSVKHIAVVTCEQNRQAQAYLAELFARMQWTTMFSGDPVQVERRFIFRDVESWTLRYG